MNKRASLSLSINAIVVLVLAITMLGLGLGFTKGMFSKFSSKLDVPPPNIPATPEDPVVLPQEELKVKHGKDFAFSVNFYNDFAHAWVTPEMDCGNLGISSIPIGQALPQVLTSSQNVDGGSFKGFKFIITNDATPAAMTGGTDICTLTFYVCDRPTSGTVCPANSAYETKQITIKIT